jgi:hypothetical protein
MAPPPQPPAYQAPPPFQAPAPPPLPGSGQPPYPAATVNVASHLVMAILATACCCLPLGIVSILYAAQVGTKLRAGDVAGAQHASSRAQLWAIIGIILGAIAIAIGVIVQLGQQGLFEKL